MSNTIKSIDATWLARYEDLPEDSVLRKFYDLRCEGVTWKAMPDSVKSKVGYHEGSLFEQRQRAIELNECLDLNGERDKMSDTQFAQWVRDQRLNYQGGMDLGTRTGLSWAELMVRAGTGEAAVRNAFKSVANADTKGLRIGHGGRFAEDRADQYQGGAKKHGWIRPVDPTNLDAELRRRALEIAGEQDADEGMVAELEGLSVKDLRAQAKELGLSGYSKLSKDELVLNIITAMAA